MFGGVLTNVI